MTTPQISVDPATGCLVIQFADRDVLVSRRQFEAVAALTDPEAVTMPLAEARRLAEIGERPCSVAGCDEPHSVAEDGNGYPRCWDHEQSAQKVSQRAWPLPVAVRGECA